MLKKIIGIDIGGTTIKMAVIDFSGTILSKWEIVTETLNQGERIPESIIESIHGELNKQGTPLEDIIGIGVGVPGPVAKGVVQRAVNLGWETMPLKSRLESGLNIPVVLLNDANAAALGELWQGSIKSVTNLVFVTLGTGVGGGIIIDGKIINGAHSSGGEIGHIPVVASTERICGCGNTNCLESYASAAGMITTINELIRNPKERVTNAEEIFSLLSSGNSEAQKTVALTIDYLARALAGIINTVDPEEIVIGGGVSAAGSALLDPLREKLKQYVFPQIREGLTLRQASLGNDAGVLGAAYESLQLYQAEEKW
ncbi:ROK family protein [Vagococcus sp. BWB3-3]|uniref:ROK family protein n=1 Tax=Vagococcus allomyrinae TaxID=2794353 RepID=A0A940SVI0_9ENTE|nr:ROK family protein [Vagococcus allomyrinae]MBP1042360.1 ROK family protein [Vagococcus allomyrinae]